MSFLSTIRKHLPCLDATPVAIKPAYKPPHISVQVLYDDWLDPEILRFAIWEEKQKPAHGQ